MISFPGNRTGRIVLFCLAIFLLPGICDAQDEVAGLFLKKERRGENIIGVQVNELIRQLTLTDPTSTARQNPYMFTYAHNSRRSNWGIRAGLGLQSGTFSGGNGFGVDTSSKVLAGNVRFGVIKSFSILDKVVCGFGADIVYNHLERELRGGSRFGGFFSEDKITAYSYGGGLVATLRYQFNKHLALGTEGSFYYVVGEQKMSNIPFSNEKINSATFNLPVAIYFIVNI